MKKYNALKDGPPDAIILTLPVAFFENRKMDPKIFGGLFEKFLSRHDDGVWNYRKTTLPTHDVLYVYLIWDGKIQYRTNLVGYERNKSKTFIDSTDGKPRNFVNANWIILSGPAVKAPHDMPMKGFQGFRYSHKLF